ncbi:TauD/TfdA family dioxygenase [Parasphingorhabdus sp. DH2-15]|uniref:TauD/TfdA family dioxygenase n=1 Tax=Parasphingorhabdus sp. DH2-15 TaxID=3444112 RepID=UPI003F6892AA
MADSEFPAIILASGSTDLAGYIAVNKAQIDEQLGAVGAVLLRGFAVPDAPAFDAAVQSYGADNFAYAESLSNAVRVNVTQRVFTANEAPPETSIYLHHEMAQTPIYPSKLFFYCEIAPSEGGATPICRSDILLDRMAIETPELLEAFATKGVRYTNVMPADNDAGSGQGRSWKSTLNAETKDAAEARLAKLGYTHEWLDNGSLRATTPVLPAVRQLADGRRSFFNQLIAAFRGWSDSRNTAHKSVSFGDDMPITGADMEPVIALSDALTYDLQWQAGDVALLDNYLVMHGRRPFAGKRRVLASLVA